MQPSHIRFDVMARSLHLHSGCRENRGADLVQQLAGRLINSAALHSIIPAPGSSFSAVGWLHPIGHQLQLLHDLQVCKSTLQCWQLKS